MQKALLPTAGSGPRARGLPPRRVCPAHPDPGLVPPGGDGRPGGGLSNSVPAGLAARPPGSECWKSLHTDRGRVPSQTLFSGQSHHVSGASSIDGRSVPQWSPTGLALVASPEASLGQEGLPSLSEPVNPGRRWCDGAGCRVSPAWPRVHARGAATPRPPGSQGHGA